jgi:hypothetical protein
VLGIRAVASRLEACPEREMRPRHAAHRAKPSSSLWSGG